MLILIFAFSNFNIQSSNYLVMEKIDIYVEQGTSLALKYAPMLGLAILTLVVGMYIINTFVRFLKRTLKKRDVDPSLIPFTSSLANVGLKSMLLISVASMALLL
jgi:small conductance mechanosensitive channel